MNLLKTQYAGIRFLWVIFITISNAHAIEAVYEGSDGMLARVFSDCVGCHASNLSGASRRGAPSSVNFDTYNAAVSSGSRAVSRGIAGTMPPGGALNSAQKNALQAWKDMGFLRSEAVANNNPTADAGQNKTVDEGDSVTLSGSGADNEDGGNVSFQWQQISGESVTLRNSNTAQPSFTAPLVSRREILAFELTVTDSGNLMASATTRVFVNNVEPVNTRPIVDAGGSQTVTEGSKVLLKGSGSDNEGDNNITFAWSQNGGIAVGLLDASSSNATFTAPEIDSASEELSFVLTVTDSKGLEATSMTTVTITNIENQPPIADAGDTQTLIEGEQGTIDGSDSFDNEDGKMLSYHWRQLSGTPIILPTSTEATVTFTTPEIITPTETLGFELMVSDSEGLNNDNTDTNTVLLTVIKKNTDFFQQLPELNAVMLDAANGGEITAFNSAAFSSALFAEGQIILDNQLTTDQTVFIASSIGVSELHLNESADLLIVAAYTPIGGTRLYFQKNSDDQFEPWDTDFLTLKAYRSQTELQMIYDLTIYSGPLEAGDYELYLGYRLVDGSVVFNSEVHIFNVR